MMLKNKHIISDILWNTSINDKNYSIELQQRISSWVRYSFERELNRVFERICPTDKIWRIEQVNLDLGQVNYSDLEYEFSARIPKLIEEEIQRLIHYQGANWNKIEVIDQGKSKIEFLEFYLEKGVKPWWHNSNEQSSLDNMVLDQLQINSLALAQLIMRIGKKENVRKRLAWQLPSASLKKIVKIIEPTNYIEIIQFKEELEKGREEQIIQSNEFEKNIWLWILTYLLVERGTFYNKVAYTKSILFQMASHENLNVHSLLKMIRRSIERLKVKTSRKVEFLNILLLLEKEENISKQETSATNQVNYWSIFNSFLEGNSQLNDSSINEVVIHLLEREKVQFLNQLKELKERKLLIVKLKPATIRKIYDELVREEQDFSKTYINALVEINSSVSISESESAIIKLVLQYFVQSKENQFTNKGFIAYYFKEKSASKKNQQKEINKLLKLLENSKESFHFDLYEDLVELKLKSNSQFGEDQQKLSLKSKFKTLIEIINNSNSTEKQWRKALVAFESQVDVAPKQAMQLLLNWTDKEELSKVFPRLLNERFIILISNQHEGINRLAYLVDQTMLRIIQSEKYSSFRFQALSELIVETGIKLQFLNPKLDLNKLVEYVFKELLIKYKGVEEKLFSIYLSVFQEVSGFNSLFEGNQLIKLVQERQKIDEANRLNQIIAKKELNKSSFGKLEISEMALHKIKSSKAIIWSEVESSVYFLFEASKQQEIKLFADKLIHYFNRNSKKSKKLIDLLCIQALSYEVHLGNVDVFKNRMFKLIKLHFPEELNMLVDQIDEPYFQKNVEKQTKAEQVWNALKIEKESTKNEKIQQMKFEDFSSTLSRHVKSQGVFDSMLCLYNLFRLFVNTEDSESFRCKLIEGSKLFIKGIKSKEVILKEMTFYALQILEVRYKLTNAEIILRLSQDRLILTKDLILSLKKKHESFDSLSNTISSNSGDLKNFENESPLVQSEEIIEANSIEISAFQYIISYKQLLRYMQFRSFTNSNKFVVLLDLYRALIGISSAKIQSIFIHKFFFKLSIQCWKNENWASLSSKQFWMELIYQISRKYQLSKAEIVRELEDVEDLMPISYKLSFKTLKVSKREIESKNLEINHQLEKVQNQTFVSFSEPELLSDPITINNAGLVLINSYISMLFSRISLIEESDFSKPKNQLDAVHVLQYIVTGEMETSEEHLSLNKVLCGLHPETPIHSGFMLSEDLKETIHGLMRAVISHWPAIGKSSIDGLRGNWLVREGVLIEFEEYWELTVDKKAYDLLINKSPFSFSIIKFPWMKKSLKVNWAY